MSSLGALYRPSAALVTDLYQLTMAYGYWRHGMAEKEGVFHLSFRSNPFGGGYTVAAGQGLVAGLLEDFRFDPEDLAYLATLSGSDGELLFPGPFLALLRDLELECEVLAVEEGRTVFPGEPLLRVQGPLLQGQLLETLLLNVVSFQSLIATKASRICSAAGEDPVLEFGLRRAQGTGGAVEGARAAYIGGCAATSNLAAGRLWGIPVSGTHAHSWVLAFEDEEAALQAYSEALPGNATLLVDTYDTKQGVEIAVRVASSLRRAGHELNGVRLDSGDLVALSRYARDVLDREGFAEARVVASGDLDEHEIVRLKEAGASIDIWGVGTRLATAWGQPAMEAVYKLLAVRGGDGEWSYRAKRSEEAAKSSTPGILQTARFRKDGRMVADVVLNEEDGVEVTTTSVVWPQRSRLELSEERPELMLKPLFGEGRPSIESPDLEELRGRVREEIGALPEEVRGLRPEARYPVGVTESLHRLRQRLLD